MLGDHSIRRPPNNNSRDEWTSMARLPSQSNSDPENIVITIAPNAETDMVIPSIECPFSNSNSFSI
jgi:hypothetical protein